MLEICADLCRKLHVKSFHHSGYKRQHTDIKIDKKKKTAVIAVDMYVYKSSQKVELPMEGIQGDFFLGICIYFFTHLKLKSGCYRKRFFIFHVNFYWPIRPLFFDVEKRSQCSEVTAIAWDLLEQICSRETFLACIAIGISWWLTSNRMVDRAVNDKFDLC